MEFKVGDRYKVLDHNKNYVPFMVTEVTYNSVKVEVYGLHEFEDVYEKNRIKRWVEHGEFKLDLEYMDRLELEQDMKDVFNS